MSVIEDCREEAGFDAVCARLARATVPAYVKDGELVYLSVSVPLASATGRRPADLLGKKDPSPTGANAEARDEAERRCLVFGKDQRVYIIAPNGDRHVIALTRARRADGTFALIALDVTQNLEALLAMAEEDLPPVPEPLAQMPHVETVENDTAATTVHEDPQSINANLQDVIEGLPIGVVVTDEHHTVQLVNGPFFDIWKVAREDLVGHHFRKLMDINRHNGIYPVTDDAWEEYVSSRISEIEKAPVAPREFTRADGVVLKYSVTRLAGGRYMICYVDITDVEKQKQAAEEARLEIERSAHLLNEAAEAMAQGLLIYDDTILLTNERFYDFLDVPRDLIKPGVPWTTLIEYCAERGDYGPPEEAKNALEYIRKSVGSGQFHQMERRGADGRWLRIDGKPTSSGMTVVTYSDITAMKEQEAELKTLIVKAEASDRAKSEFLANMSHEIRTPMNGVLGMAELLSKSDLDTRQKTYCDIVVKSGNALLTIINDILDFSKIEAGEVKLSAERFDLAEAINDVAGLMATSAQEKDIELAVRIAPELPRSVIGDGGRFRQILTNLVGNAVKFTEKGHVLVELTGERNDETVALSIRVEDTGLGIPPGKLAHIFDKFSQVDGSSTRRHEGTGLGLAITSRLVQLMGGAVDVASEEGRGSVFTVKLSMPVSEDSEPVVKRCADISGARVLIVDDNAVNRNILIDQLDGWHCDACAAESGAEGLAVLRAAAKLGLGIDCVILDHHMPEMTGLEMAAAVRDDPAISDTPILLLTSVDVDPSTAQIKALRLADWLTKPVRGDQLLDVLKGVIFSEPATTAPSPSDPATTAPNATAGRPAVFEGGRTERRAPARLPVEPINLAKRDDGGDEDDAFDLWIDSAGLAESVAGIGAALSFDDGKSQDESHLDRRISSASQSAGRPVQSGKSESTLDVLVAEDNEVNQIVFSQILDELGIVYRIVGNGEMALEVMKTVSPTLILMDVSMPVMNGHEATRQIRASEAGSDRHVPIIGVTAHALKDDRQACLDAGMDDYLSKPISPDMLERKLREWMDLDAVRGKRSEAG